MIQVSSVALGSFFYAYFNVDEREIKRNDNLPFKK